MMPMLTFLFGPNGLLAQLATAPPLGGLSLSEVYLVSLAEHAPALVSSCVQMLVAESVKVL